MKVAFYLPNKTYGHGIEKGVDYNALEFCNPGMGGTEYEILAVVYWLSRSYIGKHEIFLYAQSTQGLPDILKSNSFEIRDFKHAMELASKNNIDCFVAQAHNGTFRNHRKDLIYPSFLWNSKIKLIVWEHCSSYNFILLNCNSISSFVCVGNAQRNDAKCSFNKHKLKVIFNALNLDVNKTNFVPFVERKPEVTFMGGLVPVKGFHILAKAWKSIIAEIPDAHLNVIGSGRLYDRNAPLGKWNIASPSYEELFMPYLLDEKGDLLPSVTFLGVLGDEKNKVLGRTKVGVPNPLGTGRGRETFCISAVEMQMYGALISTIKRGGYIDTVYDQNSLFEKHEDLAAHVISQLKKTENDKYSDCMEYFENNFSFKSACNKWNELFDMVEQENRPSIFRNFIPFVICQILALPKFAFHSIKNAFVK